MASVGPLDGKRTTTFGGEERYPSRDLFEKMYSASELRRSLISLQSPMEV